MATVDIELANWALDEARRKGASAKRGRGERANRPSWPTEVGFGVVNPITARRKAGSIRPQVVT